MEAFDEMRGDVGASASLTCTVWCSVTGNAIVSWYAHGTMDGGMVGVPDRNDSAATLDELMTKWRKRVAEIRANVKSMFGEVSSLTEFKNQ